MNNSRLFFSRIGKLILAGLTAVIILSLVAVVYRYEGVHIKNSSGATDYKWEPGQLKSQMVEGFSFLRMDENGFNNAAVIDDQPDILLMGSSHMEAVELMQKDSLAYLLNDMLSPLSTYNIGISGHTIYRCADNFKSAVNRYNPKKYVIIETDRIEFDVDEMKSVIDGSAAPIPSYDSGLLFYMQKIPAIKVLYSQFDKWISESTEIEFESPCTVNFGDDSENDDKTDITDDYKETLRELLKKISVSADENGIKVIIFFHPPESLDKDGRVSYGEDEDSFSVFSEECKKQGIIFADMTPDFEKLYNEKHIMAHGFSNTAVGVGHMNKYAHRVIAEKLSEIINEAEADK